MTDTIGSRLRGKLAEKGWNQSDLVRETGIDKNTISAIANDRSQARASTLARIEEALGLTLGTLAASGEEVALGAPAVADLKSVEDARLISELSFRLESAKRAAERLEREAEELAAVTTFGFRLQGVLHDWIQRAERSEVPWQQAIASEISHLFHLDHEGELDAAGEERLRDLEDLALLHGLAEMLGYRAEKNRIRSLGDHRRSKMLEDAQPVQRAAAPEDPEDEE